MNDDAYKDNFILRCLLLQSFAMKLLVVSAAVFGTSVYIARRLISRKWIDYRSVEHDLNGKVIIVTGGNTGTWP